MTLDELQLAENRLLLPTYARVPILFTGGHGVFLIDEKGNDYLDLLSGIGVSALGYSNDVLRSAIIAQSQRLLHTSNLFFHEHTATLALHLTELSGMDKVFLCNSGTEAWEAALKLARAHAHGVRAEGGNLGTKFLALEHSFHGRTFGSVATTHKLQYRSPFAPVMPDVEFIRFNDTNDLKEHFSREVCGICVEVVQGEGGIHLLSKDFLALARELCDSTGALLIADEIQCGFGRTGNWFAYQQLDIQPDVTTIAKPLAGGLPAGAMLCTNRAAAAFAPGMHGSTFGGGPLVCSVATAVIEEILQRDLLSSIRDVGKFFIAELRRLADRYTFVKDVRGLGLMLGLELESEQLAEKVATEMLSRRIILNRTSGNILRFLPPYIIERSHIMLAVAALEEIFASHAALAEASSGGIAHGVV